jgi:hypothetical protein
MLRQKENVWKALLPVLRNHPGISFKGWRRIKILTLE